MAPRHGKNAAVTVNAVSLTPYCDTAGIDIDTDTAETSAFGAAWKTYLAGLSGGTQKLSGNYDPTAVSGPIIVLSGIITAGVAVPVIYYPGGNTAGQISISFSAILTKLSIGSAVVGKVTFSADVLITGAVTWAII